jgi:endonuclease G
LLETEPSTARAGRRPLTVDPGPPKPGDRVVAVGFPGDPRDEPEPLFARAVFGERDVGLKRAAPGELISVHPRHGAPERVHHDCSTLKGASGGPLLSMATGAVVGVHRHGAFLTRNEAVAACQLEALLSSLDPPNRTSD